MRRYDESVEVRSGRIGEGIIGLDQTQLGAWPEGPAQFVWRDRLWRVLGVQARWVESGAWWTGPAVRAARGDDSHAGLRPAIAVTGLTRATDAAPGVATDVVATDVVATDLVVRDADEGDDLLCEQEVWRVEAANGREGSRGVYELAHAWADGSWRLRSVLD